MARLIDADVLMEAELDFDTVDDCVMFRDAIDNAPTVEAEPVIHAHWIPQYVSTRGNTDKFECSNCNALSHTAYMMKMCPDNYCKNCGAKMDKE